jgi:seryl-tRNA synthetase
MSKKRAVLGYAGLLKLSAAIAADRAELHGAKVTYSELAERYAKRLELTVNAEQIKQVCDSLNIVIESPKAKNGSWASNLAQTVADLQAQVAALTARLDAYDQEFGK